MLPVDDEVDLEVELELLVLKVFLLHISWDQRIERPEELLLVAFVEAGLNLQKKLLWLHVVLVVFPLLVSRARPRPRGRL